MMYDNYYTFTAIRGKQGNHDYFVINCPLQLVPRIFIFDQITATSSGFRYETLSSSQVEKIGKYMISNVDNFMLAPVIVTVDGELFFDKLQPGAEDVVSLRISFDARMNVIEGKHRCAAIQLALANKAKLRSQTIPVMIVPDPQTLRSKNLQIGLELEASPSSLSYRVFQNEEEPLSALVKELANVVPVFQNRIEVNKTTISNRSTMLFTLSALYQATKALLGVDKSGVVTEAQQQTACQFWHKIAATIPEWHKLLIGEVTPSYLRENYVHAHTMMLVSIGKVGYHLISEYPDEWSSKLEPLGHLDWSRSNGDLWEGRAMIQGRMSKAHRHINLTVNILKQTLGLSLNDKEQLLESDLL